MEIIKINNMKGNKIKKSKKSVIKMVKGGTAAITRRNSKIDYSAFKDINSMLYWL